MGKVKIEFLLGVDMDRKEMMFVLQNIRSSCGLCRTEKEAIDQMIDMVENDPYIEALHDVENVIQNNMCSIRNGRLMMIEDGSFWINVIDVLKVEHDERGEF